MGSARESKHLCIVGLMGVGKSTVARLVGDRLGWPVIDSDPWIEARHGESGREIAARDGVDALHAIEAAMLEEALSRSPAVITPAASIVEHQRSRDLLTRGAFVAWLDLDPETAYERSQAGSHRRPTTLDDFRDMFRKRRSAFESTADLRLDARRTPQDLADAVVAAFQSSSSS